MNALLILSRNENKDKRFRGQECPIVATMSDELRVAGLEAIQGIHLLLRRYCEV
jgi:hypothetical protein